MGVDEGTAERLAYSAAWPSPTLHRHPAPDAQPAGACVARAASVVKRSWASIWRKSAARGLAALRKAAAPAKKKRPALAKPRPKPKAKPKPAFTLAPKPRLKSGPKSKPALEPQATFARAVDGWIQGVAIAAAGVRRFRLYRPAGLLPGEPVPLLVMLHGCGQDARSFAASTRMNQLAARERFVVLYPEQDRLANSQGCWNWFETRSGRAQGEAQLIMAAIDQVCLLHPVDSQRVAVAGLSAGASMATLLVTRHPERFRAVVMHSGVPPGTANTPLSALGAMRGRRAVAPLPVTPAVMAASWPPLLVIHGALDTVVSPRNGRAAAHAWANAAGARASATRRVQRGERYAMDITDFKCKGRAVATLVEVDRLGHAWSGGAASEHFSDPKGPDASRMVWAFAARQFRQAALPVPLGV